MLYIGACLIKSDPVLIISMMANRFHHRPTIRRALVLGLAITLIGAAPLSAIEGSAKGASSEYGKAMRLAAVGGANAATEIAALEAPIDGHSRSALGPEGLAEVPLPKPLGKKDAVRYARILELQKEGEWAAADREIKELKNRLLMGHVLFQRYMHPTKYRSKFAELRDWMKLYADHPGAKRIYRLAMRRKPAKSKDPVKPKGEYFYGSGTDPGAQIELPYVSSKKLSKRQKKVVADLRAKIRHYVRRGSPTKARNLLAKSPARKLLDRVETDILRARIAAGYFSAGKDEQALAMAAAIAKRSGKRVPRAHWTAGLAAWRLGRLNEAAAHFETLAISDTTSGWNAAAAAYWAARAHLLARRPGKVNHWLNIAALHSRTFYGLLARRNLGLPTYFNWATPPLSRKKISRLAAISGGKRTLALIQLGRHSLAEEELRKIYPRADADLGGTVLAVAMKADLPGLSMRIGSEWGEETDNFNDGALYPVAEWSPEGGFQVDRALVFAIIRQESRFDADAKSPAGARGLMQLMPRTAGFLAGGKRFRGASSDQLFDPQLNIALGQKYLLQLLNHENIQGNLFLLAAAYNGGPGNLAKWRRKTNYQHDPLLFIEAVPSPETRIFIEKVLTNLWIYRHRLGQPTPSLDAIAAGEWPLYRSLDGEKIRMAKHAGN